MTAAHEPGSTSRGHEDRDVAVRPMVWTAVLLVVCGGLIQVAVYMAMSHLERQRLETFAPASPLARERLVPPAPRLQLSPAEDLQAMRARERQVLGSYGWVDRPHGVVRIPIERAMALIAQRVPATQASHATTDKHK